MAPGLRRAGGRPDDSASLPTEPLGVRTLGNPDAPVKIEEFASLTCGHCAHFHGTTFQELKTKYIDTGKVFFTFTDFPLNAPALDASMVARCMAPERYFTFLSFLMETQEQWAFSADYKTSLRQNAKLAGMSDEAFDSCLANTALKDGLVDRMKAKAEENKLNSTPSFVITGPAGKSTLTGALPIVSFDAAIEEAQTGAAPVEETPAAVEATPTEETEAASSRNKTRCAAKYRREHELIGPKNKNYTPVNFPILRYSDVLLMIAEADNELTPEPSALAYECIDAVRNRAGILPLSGRSLSKSQFRDAVKKERAMELCFEAGRRWDLIRWGEFGTTMRSMQGYVNQEGWGGSFKYASAYYNVPDTYTYFPIPDSEMSINKLITTNNPGW